MVYRKVGETLHGLVKWECGACGSVFTTTKRKPKIHATEDEQNPSWAGNREGCKFCWVKL